jgi:hypothetical protein
MSIKLHCPKCKSTIGEMSEDVGHLETYFHKNKDGEQVCLRCEFEKGRRRAEISFFIIAALSIFIVLLSFLSNTQKNM